MMTPHPASLSLVLLALTNSTHGVMFQRHVTPRLDSKAASSWTPVTQTYIDAGFSPGEHAEAVINPLDVQYEIVKNQEFSKRLGHPGLPDYETRHRRVLASPRQDSPGLTVAGLPLGLANELFQNIGGFTLWLNLLLKSQMDHYNLTKQIQSLTSELEDTKSSLLTKLEDDAGAVEELFHNISIVLEAGSGVLDTEVDSHHPGSHHSGTNNLEAPVSALSLATSSSTAGMSSSLTGTSPPASLLLAQIVSASPGSPSTSSGSSAESGTSDANREEESLSENFTDTQFENETFLLEAILSEIVKRMVGKDA